MLDLLISRAATQSAQAAERVRALGEQLAGKALGSVQSSADSLVKQAQTSMQNATVSLVQAAESMAVRSLDQAQAKLIQRGLGAVNNAVTKINRGITKSLGPEAARVLQGPVGEVAKQLTGALLNAQRQFDAVNPLKRGIAAAVSSLSKMLKLPSIPAIAAGGRPHLLILTSELGDYFYFSVSTAAFDKFSRQTSYNYAVQSRLKRADALQPVNLGGETISLSGAIFTATEAGGRQIDKLRKIGNAMQPVQLTTGYGEVLGRWCLTQISEEQEAHLADGAPRKQTFSLEFKRYGDDYPNL